MSSRTYQPSSTARFKDFGQVPAAGDPLGAATAFETLVLDYLRILGPDHPLTLENQAILAWWQGAAGDPATAISTIENLLADCLRVLGPDHPITLSARKNLAHWQAKAADPATRTQPGG